MDIPAEFSAKITRTFAQKGIEWLEQLPALTRACQQKWQLTDCRIAGDLSYNFVCFARSESFGDVALKIGVPHLDLFSEMKAIHHFSGHGMCRCYDSDESLGAMLLERVQPGADLWTVADHLRRYEIAAEIMEQMHILAPDDHGLPLFTGLIENAITRGQAEQIVDESIIERLRKILAMAKSMERRYPRQVILHCDLHHANILRDGGSWKAIDPKGFVGPRPIECARFIENEVEDFDPADHPRQIGLMISKFAPALGVSAADAATALTIDSVLSSYWTVEDHGTEEEIRAAWRQCDIFENYYQSIRVD